MKTIILSAGRGSRLLPLTETRPKCLLPVGETTVLGRQLDTLEAAGVSEAVVVTGFMTALVEDEVARRSGPMPVTTMFNPFFQIADNLASCWMVRDHMDGDFLLINGDTLFEAALLEDVLNSPHELPVQVTIDRKSAYDSDDMKVQLDGSRLRAIGKSLPPERADAESIGMLRFTGEGPAIYRAKLEQMMRTQDGVSQWFLKAIDAIASTTGQVGTFSIEGRRWNEVDTVEDYEGIDGYFKT
ncbi:bifunctional IPC transferase and DIPP synthase [Roseovarius sp. A-2]|uniref:phosphocholine cytidylyltransferase family protein n=1 Tax=Roseovarius sp. A-2 TaxID=1570360 RepID=UPI0009B54C2F|nr:phosphocholine cytidylyltransferase family protein [Roseovarius sp. A-2]GAW33338.1 bifunctional IPC transferase and DIPP synthase [Roseovarius sp. A-2]